MARPWAGRGRGGGRGGEASRGGRGGRAGRGRGQNLHNSAGPDDGQCWAFLRGDCSLGANCKYAHRQPLTPEQGAGLPTDEQPQPDPGLPNSNQHRAQEERVEDPMQDVFSACKRMIKTKPNADALYSLLFVYTRALDVMDNGGKGLRQDIPKLLASDGDNKDRINGLAHVLAVAEMSPQRINSGRGEAVIKAFLSVVTHDGLLHCLSVEKYVDQIYDTIAGPDGSRGIKFLQATCDYFLLQFSIASDSLEGKEEFVFSLATCLQTILWKNQRIISAVGLPSLLRALDLLVEKLQPSGPSAAVHFKLTQRLKLLHRLRDRSDTQLAEEESDPTPVARAPWTAGTYWRENGVPGGRHDNDHTDITKISIFPTDEEIRSDVEEYLPLADPAAQSQYQGAERLLNQHFRLLRSDIFGQLKSALNGVMKASEKQQEFDQASFGIIANTNAYHYPKARVSFVGFDKVRGLEFQITFQQPHHLQGNTKMAQKLQHWWQASKRLDEGTLLALVTLQDGKCASTLFTVSQKQLAGKFSLSSNANVGFISVRLSCEEDTPTIQRLVRASLRNTAVTEGVLVEFPGLLPATFKPILENLQHMQQYSRLPFAEWVTPRTSMATAVNAVCKVPPPLYSRSPGFTFDLQPILSDPSGQMRLDPTVAVSPALTRTLAASTTLDQGQCEALINALTTEFSLIQGPPGTGKSYLGVELMRVLLKNRDRAKLGPVLVVCYTNHALDQFLEHLVEKGIDQVVRIGGSSKSDVLVERNLVKLSRTEDKTQDEKQQVGRAYSEAEKAADSIRKKLIILATMRQDWKSLSRYVATYHPNYLHQFSRIDQEGFEDAGKTHPFDRWVKGQRRSEQPDLASANASVEGHINLWALSSEERWQLLDTWQHENAAVLSDEIGDLISNWSQSKLNKMRCHDEVDHRVLDKAEVIGVTTSGLAKRIAVLRHLKAKVVICEEAGEVLEAHMLSALIPSVEHIIQIGDHQQLRPLINNYSLSLESDEGRKYSLDLSQFERLCSDTEGQGRFPFSQLNIQRRMRPEISRLIRQTQYPRLMDHEVVRSYPNVVGMRKNVFWLDHTRFEDNQGYAVQKSKTNDWEADMTHALVRHIVRQGVYTSQDIAVLTPYAGQLQKLRGKLSTDFEIVLSDRDEEKLVKEGFTSDTAAKSAESEDKAGAPILQKKSLDRLLRIATVDNFQGEEAKIVIVSLVRSNDAKKVGFLKTENRINVLLSRAKEGMFIIGNAETYAGIKMWSDVIGMLRVDDSVGDALALCCPRHPETSIEVSEPKQFAALSPEGGCTLPCDKRLPDCGHRCLSKCHSDAMHNAFQCPQPCPRLHPCSHACPKLCSEDCGPCQEPLDGIMLPCGHEKDQVPCHLTTTPTKITCRVPVEKNVPNCGHHVVVHCSKDPEAANFKCPHLCSAILTCGHSCSGTCHSCNAVKADGKGEHIACTTPYGRSYNTCNHIDRNACHDGKECVPCVQRCQVQCRHSGCKETCSSACAPCIEPCSWEGCEHQPEACQMPCSAACNRVPCSKRSSAILSCGCRSPGICGEDVSSAYCQNCCSEDKQHHRVDVLEMKTYEELDLDETPIVVLSCGHFFTAETLDGHMGMADVYSVDVETGEYDGLKDLSISLAQPPPRCPDCQGTIQQYVTQRYGRVINRSVNDEISKRFIVSGQHNMRSLSRQADEVQQALEQARAAAFEEAVAERSAAKRIVTSHVSKPEKGASKLLGDIQQFLTDLQKRGQPARKLEHATVLAMRRSVTTAQSLDSALANLQVSKPTDATPPRDNRIVFGARLLFLTTKFSWLEHRLAIANEMSKFAPGQQDTVSKDDIRAVTSFYKLCEGLIEDSEAEKLPRIEAESRVLAARTTRLLQTTPMAARCAVLQVKDRMAQAQELLTGALALCDRRFEGADALRKFIEVLQEALVAERYEAVSKEEVEMVKAAMLSNIGRHAGHWYNCRNGHPFAIGECGLPMQQARCPECGEPVGGTNHQMVQGVSLDTEMGGVALN